MGDNQNFAAVKIQPWRCTEECVPWLSVEKGSCASKRSAKYLYDKGDYKSFTEELLDIDWEEAFDGMLLEDM